MRAIRSISTRIPLVAALVAALARASSLEAQDANATEAFTLMAAAARGEPVRLLWNLPGWSWPAGGFRVERLDGRRVTVLAEGWQPGSDKEALATLPPEAQQELGRGAAYFASSPWRQDSPLPPEEGVEVLHFEEPEMAVKLTVFQAFSDYTLARALGLAFVDPQPLAAGRRYRVMALNASGAPIASAAAGPFDPGGIPLPPPPVEVEIRSEREGVVISWQAPPASAGPPGVPPAFAYRLLRRSTPGAQPEEVLPQPLVPSFDPHATYLDGDAPIGSALEYSLRSVDPFGRSGLEGPGVAIEHRDHAALEPPAGLMVEAAPGRAVLSWEPNPSTATAGYRVSRSFNAQGPYVVLNEKPVTEPRFEDTSGHPGTTYFYSVQSIDRRDEAGPHSSPRDARFARASALPAPAGLEATLGYGRILLRWRAAADTAVAGYRVERSGGADDAFSILNGELMPLPEFEDPFSPGTTGVWRYRVVAVGTDDMESSPSDVLEVPLPRIRPPRPPRIVDVDNDAVGVKLAWQAVGSEEDVASWLVLRSTDPRDPAPMLAGASLPAATRGYIDKGAEPGLPYSYWIVAVDRAGNRSDPAGPVRIQRTTLEVPEPPAPTAEWVTPNDDPQPIVRLAFSPPPATARWILQRRESDEIWLRIGGPFDQHVEDAFDHRPPRGVPVVYRLVGIGADNRPGTAGPETKLEESPR